jgi:hypothetical protein
MLIASQQHFEHFPFYDITHTWFLMYEDVETLQTI